MAKKTKEIIGPMGRVVVPEDEAEKLLATDKYREIDEKPKKAKKKGAK